PLGCSYRQYGRFFALIQSKKGSSGQTRGPCGASQPDAPQGPGVAETGVGGDSNADSRRVLSFLNTCALNCLESDSSPVHLAVDGSGERAGTNPRRLLQGAFQREAAGCVGEAPRTAGDGVVLDNRECGGTCPGCLSINACGQGVAVCRSEGRRPCPVQLQNVD